MALLLRYFYRAGSANIPMKLIMIYTSKCQLLKSMLYAGVFNHNLKSEILDRSYAFAMKHINPVSVGSGTKQFQQERLKYYALLFQMLILCSSFAFRRCIQ